MIFSVSNDGIEWSLDFGPDSDTQTVKDFVQEMKIRSKQILLTAWSFLMSQTQDLFSNHLARVPVTPKDEGLWR